ncbi:MAG: TIGR00725 family protein [Actinomycetes bacterium]
MAVVGPADATPEISALAEDVGRRLAEAGAVVITGGLGGVMAAASRGAKLAGGLTVGLLPGRDRDTANEWLDVAIPTGLAELRNALVAGSAAAVIAVGGSWGTLSELAFARRLGRTVITLRSWQVLDETGAAVPESFTVAPDAETAVALALASQA